MMKRTLFCLGAFLLLAAALPACDMSALIIRQDRVFADFSQPLNSALYDNFNHPADYLAHVISSSAEGRNDDGYGLIYYERGSSQLKADNYAYKHVHSAAEANQVWYTGHYFESNNPADVFDAFLARLQAGRIRSGIVLAHARNATANPFAPGNHPFRLDLNKITYTFMHNGYATETLRGFLINETAGLDPLWFQNHKPNYSDYAGAANPGQWIDSEVLFHYLMCHIVEAGGNVRAGLQAALAKIKEEMSQPFNVLNFILSDGEKLYAFRSTPTLGAGSGYKLSYKINAQGFSGIRTGVPQENENQLQQYELVILNGEGEAERHPELLSEAPRTPARQPDGQGPLHQRQFGVLPGQHPGGVSIAFELEKEMRVRINVYNIRGQLVRKLSDSMLPKGSHTITWNGRDQAGRPVASGMYCIAVDQDKRRFLFRAAYAR